MKNKKIQLFISLGSIVALFMGFIYGLFFLGDQTSGTASFVKWVDFVGKLWILIMFIITIPLVAGIIISSVLSLFNTKKAGKIAGISFLVHYAVFIIGMIFTVGLTYLFLAGFGDLIPHLNDPSSVEELSNNAKSEGSGLVDYGIGLILSTQRIIGIYFIYLFVLSVIFSLVAMHFSEGQRKKICSVTKRMSDWIMICFTNYLITMPFAVFCLILPLAARTGFASLEVSIYFIGLLSALLILFLMFLFLLVYMRGAVSLRQFLQAMLPSNVIALSSRSSLATIPAMIEAAEKRMHIPTPIAAIIIPFMTSTFRLNLAISGPFALIFMGVIFEVPISFYTVILYCGSMLFINLGSPGVPSGSRGILLPILLSAGLPVEAYILIKLLDGIPDIFKTVLNVNHTMTMVTLISRKEKLNEFQSEPILS